MANILFVGDLNRYARSLQRFETLERLGHSVQGISNVPDRTLSDSNRAATLFERLTWKIGFPLADNCANRDIADSIRFRHFDLVWIENAVSIRPGVLSYIRGKLPDAKILYFTEDDICVTHNRSIWQDRALKLVDYIYTTKDHNLAPLRSSYPQAKVELTNNTYCDHVHRIPTLSLEDREIYAADVVAIGAYEDTRATMIVELARLGIDVDVWGLGWSNLKRHEIRGLRIHDRFLCREEYAKATFAAKINLNFLRKINFDVITSRSVEIPACGGFMLTERSNAHSSLFEMGVDADDFGSVSELYEKVVFYLEETELRVNAARRGYHKVTEGGYGMTAQLHKIMQNIR